MPQTNSGYRQESFLSRGNTIGFTRKYNLSNSYFEVESFHTLCGNDDNLPYSIMVKYPDATRARIYTDFPPKDGVIDSATTVPYPFESVSPKDYPSPCPKGLGHQA